MVCICFKVFAERPKRSRLNILLTGITGFKLLLATIHLFSPFEFKTLITLNHLNLLIMLICILYIYIKTP